MRGSTENESPGPRVTGAQAGTGCSGRPLSGRGIPGVRHTAPRGQRDPSASGRSVALEASPLTQKALRCVHTGCRGDGSEAGGRRRAGPLARPPHPGQHPPRPPPPRRRAYFPSSSKSWYSSVNRVQVVVEAILGPGCPRARSPSASESGRPRGSRGAAVTAEGASSCAPPGCPSRRRAALFQPPSRTQGQSAQERGREMANSRRGRAASSQQLRTIRGPAGGAEEPASRGGGWGPGRDSSPGGGAWSGGWAGPGAGAGPGRLAPVDRPPPASRRPPYAPGDPSPCPRGTQGRPSEERPGQAGWTEDCASRDLQGCGPPARATAPGRASLPQDCPRSPPPRLFQVGVLTLGQPP